MCIISLVVLILYLSFHQVHLTEVAQIETKEPAIIFDILTFSQLWPITQCKIWTYIEHPGGKCVFPNKKNQWTVHGIWPQSQTGGVEPLYCNNSWPLDRELIKTLERDLDQAWTNVYKEEPHYGFWNHEWTKHGTCATVLEPFNSQLKYFKNGIEWNRKYSIADMLENAGIFPSDTKELTPDELADAVKAKTKKDPMIACETIHESQYLVELRICFDKQINIVDCIPVNICDVSKRIIFPANV